MSVAERPHVSFLGLGERLSEARLARGLDLHDVERETRVRVRYLAALEQERFDALPGGAYARAFLRTYAGYLGLDADACVEDLRRLRGEPDEAIVPSPAARPPRRRPWLPGVVAATAIAGTVLGSLGLVRLLEGDAEPPPAPAPSRPERASITAARGDSSLAVRLGDGRLVWRGTLRRGRTIRFGLAQPLRVRFGAPENVRVRIGDQPVDVSPELVLSST